MLLSLAIRASRRGWVKLSDFLMELDLLISGLSGASRRIRRSQAQRRQRPFVEISMEGPGL